MSYGLELFKADGSLGFSSEDMTWTLLGVYTSAANTNATHTNVPVMPNRVVTRLMVDQVSGDDEAYVHTYTLTGSTLTTIRPSASDTVETVFMVFGK